MDCVATRTGNDVRVSNIEGWTITHENGSESASIFDNSGKFVDEICFLDCDEDDVTVEVDWLAYILEAHLQGRSGEESWGNLEFPV